MRWEKEKERNNSDNIKWKEWMRLKQKIAKEIKGKEIWNKVKKMKDEDDKKENKRNCSVIKR